MQEPKETAGARPGLTVVEAANAFDADRLTDAGMEP